jgi:hypothetical protein
MSIAPGILFADLVIFYLVLGVCSLEAVGDSA